MSLTYIRSNNYDCMQKILEKPTFDLFLNSLNTKEKKFFENMCLQSCSDIDRLLKDCMKYKKNNKNSNF